MKPRQNGPKGWRLELQNTSHRSNIQIHRAHSPMFIQGCILPVKLNHFFRAGLKKGDPPIQKHSIALMNRIRNRYEIIKKGETGNPSLTISATLPAIHIKQGDSIYA